MPESVALNVGISPATGLFPASLSVMVIVDVSLPSEIVGEVPVIVEFAATATSEVKTTVPPVTVTGVKSISVFVSAIEDARVQVESPVASVNEQGP